MSSGQFVRQRALVHFGVMQDEVFRVQELTLELEAGAGIGAGIYEMRPADPTLGLEIAITFSRNAHQPSRMGLVPKRSPRRASASSTAREPASVAQSSRSGTTNVTCYLSRPETLEGAGGFVAG